MTNSKVNGSGVKPLGRAVLVEYYEPERKESVIFIPETVQDKTVLLEQRAVVVEAGPEAWRDEREPRALPGDRVLISRFSGYALRGPADNRQYRVVNDNDIFAAITTE